MTTAQLSQYLETAVDLEKAVFLQARRLAQYKEEIQALDRAARRPAPAPPEAAPVAPVPKPPMEPLREILGKTLLGFLLSLAAVTGISVLTMPGFLFCLSCQFFLSGCPYIMYQTSYKNKSHH